MLYANALNNIRDAISHEYMRMKAIIICAVMVAMRTYGTNRIGNGVYREFPTRCHRIHLEAEKAVAVFLSHQT